MQTQTTLESYKSSIMISNNFSKPRQSRNEMAISSQMIVNKSTPSGIYQPNPNMTSVGHGSMSNLSTIYHNQPHATLFSQGGTNDVCSSGF